MSLKFQEKDKIAELVSGMISEFALFTRNNQEVCELWKILGYQIDAYDRATSELTQMNSIVLNTNSYDDGRSESGKKQSQPYQEIIQATCKVLEEEFLTQISSQNKSTTSYIQQYDGGVNDEDRNFIIQEYMESSFRNKNYIEFDDRTYPVWAICYLYFRTGRMEELQKFLARYEGSLKGEITKFNQFLAKYHANKGELDYEARQEVLQSLDSGEQNIDVFKQMLYFILAKSEDIPSEELVSRLGDYLWFNLKICTPNQKDLAAGRGLRVQNNAITLFDIQRRILDFPPEHFNPGNNIPLNYVKTLFIIGAYDEALHFLREYELYHEEFIHFAICLFESGLITLRWEYSGLAQKYEFKFFKDNEYCSEIIEYATSFCEKNPLEACLYLRLLCPDKDPANENNKKKQLIVETISNFVISNDQIHMFFDKTREAQKNAAYLEDIVGNSIYKEIILAITKHYKKSKLQIAIVLLDKIEFYQEVLELILEEEYESLKKFKEKFKGKEIATTKSQYDSFFNEILDRYGRKNILNKFRFTYTSYEFVKKVKALWENYSKKNFNDAFELLRKWDHEWYIFGYNENEILEEFTSNHAIVQLCYLDLISVSAKIIKRYNIYIRESQKTPDHIASKLKEAEILSRKLASFYKKVKPRFSADQKNNSILKELDEEITVLNLREIQ